MATSTLLIKSVQHESGCVQLTLSDGSVLSLEECWLRDNCRCESCYHADTFQRALHILDIPDATAASVETGAKGDELLITWSDSHKSSFSLDFLARHSRERYLADRHRSPHEWRGLQVAALVARVPLREFLDTEAGARRLFKSLLDYGVAFVEGVKADLEGTEEVCEALGGVQRTLFGGMWRFTTEAEHADTAYSNLPLAPHTDNTYFTEAAGLQVLHCVEHTGGSGGDTVLVDGLAGAELLRREAPDQFRFLSDHVSEAEYLETGHHHRHAAPIVRLHPITGEIEQIRFNVYDRSPGAFTSGKECRAYYAALRALASIYGDKNNQWWFKLTPGTVLVMDNWRVLHGRSAFTGRRVLCGSYVSRSDWLDRARVLALLV